LDSESDGGGAVSKQPDRVYFDPGTTVTLTATASFGYTFLGWDIDGATLASADNPLHVVMNAYHTVRARFRGWPVTVTAKGDGNGTATRTPDQAIYHVGDHVTLAAVPDRGRCFWYWTGDVPVGQWQVNPLAFTVVTTTTLTAHFTLVNYPVAVSVGGSGSVAKSPDLASYDYATTVTLTAIPATGHRFAGWTGDVPPGRESVNPLALAVDTTKTLTAEFVPLTFAIAARAAGGGGPDGSGGTVTRQPDQALYDWGSVVTLTARGGFGFRFRLWTGDVPPGRSLENPLVLTVDTTRTLTGQFGLDGSSWLLLR
jgi:hypothetical protein